MYFFDTVTLSNFALADRLDLLVSRYGTDLCVTEEVRTELAQGVMVGYENLTAIEEIIGEVRFNTASPMSPGESREYRELLRTLGPGEASCIAMAKHRSGTVVTDDKTARQCCAHRGVPFTGTIGILHAMCVGGLLTPRDSDMVLSAMVDAGFRSPIRRISDII